MSKSSLDVCYFVDLPLALKSFTAFLLYTKGNKEGNLRLSLQIKLRTTLFWYCQCSSLKMRVKIKGLSLRIIIAVLSNLYRGSIFEVGSSLTFFFFFFAKEFSTLKVSCCFYNHSKIFLPWMFSKNYFPYTTAAGPCTVNINTLIEKELKLKGSLLSEMP